MRRFHEVKIIGKAKLMIVWQINSVPNFFFFFYTSFTHYENPMIGYNHFAKEPFNFQIPTLCNPASGFNGAYRMYYYYPCQLAKLHLAHRAYCPRHRHPSPLLSSTLHDSSVSIIYLCTYNIHERYVIRCTRIRTPSWTRWAQLRRPFCRNLCDQTRAGDLTTVVRRTDGHAPYTRKRLEQPSRARVRYLFTICSKYSIYTSCPDARWRCLVYLYESCTMIVFIFRKPPNNIAVH